MTRVKRGNVARLHRKKILKRAKGFKGSHSKLFRVANQQVMKALKYSYIGRKHETEVGHRRTPNSSMFEMFRAWTRLSASDGCQTKCARS